ncbi:MAG: enoyl-CoA hydratase/isomerase family protein [SAR86 cluster bacterium]|jgi:2-(1,2-epoxy-1,2-dihydrophenyl)acetyl-CoA isomerase|nr:enoyl-CoA hydratase/isomerase family protein [SAR86 cluster bacterium]|tara:strand:+ start:12894 stop:13670 length:777 start_codon:yes stop_codon:yes gene_type:complete
MDFKTLLFEIKNNIAVISFNRPEKRNAFNRQMVEDIEVATSVVKEEKSIRCLVLTGTGLGFCAGADLSEKDANWKDTEEALVKGYLPSLKNIMQMSKPVISAVNGGAAGVGSAYAMACDLTIMAEDSYILQAFSNIGLIPDGGASWLLSNTIGYKLAYQIAIEGERLSASKCLELGLANKVVPSESLLEEAISWAEILSLKSPQALSSTKDIMRASIDSSYLETYLAEAKEQNRLFGTPDNVEGIKAFIEKRKPKFSD